MSETNDSNSKRIAKNSTFIYMRMILVMCVSFFTSRVILQSLGVVDFGIYNVVAGITCSFVFFSVTLSASTQRFLNYELGKNNTVRLNQIFNLSLMCFIGIGLLVLVVGLCLGSWIISEKLTIPTERQGDAIIVFYCALLSLLTLFVFSVYESVLIAHENMKVYAWLGVFDAIMKLTIAYLVFVFPHKLVVYAIMMAMAQVLSKLILLIYCRRKYSECKLRFYWDKKMFREIFIFSGWNVVNGGIWMVNEQGSNVLLNLFFGPIANAAYGIVMQVYSTVSSISSNFFVAFKPQIVKSYAAGDFGYVRSLAFSSSRYTLYVTWLIALPIMLRAQDILTIWLVEYPHYAVPMIQTAMIFLLTVVLSNPANMVAMATGQLKKMTIFSSGVYLLAFPVIWFSLRVGQQPYFVFIVLAVHRFLWTIITYIVVRKDIIISLSDFFKKVIFPSVCVIFVSLLVSYVFNQLIVHNLLGLICFAVLSVLSTAAIVFVVGMQKNERSILKKYIIQLFNKKKSENTTNATVPSTLPLVSVIVPVYNVEKYINECVDSILAQTYKNIEVILVDDGSPDRCPQICDDYAAAHSNIRVVHKSNGGLSSARNAGLDVSIGEYVMFVDSDDTILPEMLAGLMAEALAHGFDIVGSNLASLDGKRRIRHKATKRMEFTGYGALNDFLRQKIDSSSCTKVYRRDIIGKTRFIVGRRNEDFPFLIEVYGKKPRVCYLPVGYYQYRTTAGSITNVFNKSYFDQLLNIKDVAYVKDFDTSVENAYIVCHTRRCVDMARDVLVHKATKQYPDQFKFCMDIINAQKGNILTFKYGWRCFVKFFVGRMLFIRDYFQSR